MRVWVETFHFSNIILLPSPLGEGLGGEASLFLEHLLREIGTS